MDINISCKFVLTLGKCWAYEVICYVEKLGVAEIFEDAQGAKNQWPHAFLLEGLSKWNYVTDRDLKSNVKDVGGRLLEAIDGEI